MTDKIFFLFTCVKNGTKYINKLFESLKSQTKKNFVHYIYDDGSTDNLDIFVEKYKKDVQNLNNPYEIIYEKNTKNIGLNLSTQHCIEKCQCKFFIWIDCDNYVDSTFFEELEKGIKKHPNRIVYRTKRFLVNNHGMTLNEPTNSKFSIKARSHYEKLIMLNKYYFSFFAVDSNMFKNILGTHKLLNEKTFFNDVQVLLLCSKSKTDFVYVDKAIGFCLIRESSESYVNFEHSRENQFNLYNKFNMIHNFSEVNVFIYKSLLDLNEQYCAFFNNHNFIRAKQCVKTKNDILKNNNIPHNLCRFVKPSLIDFCAYFFPKLMNTLLNKYF